MFYLNYPIELLSNKGTKMLPFYKFFFFSTIHLIISASIYAKPIEQKDVDFPIKSQKLLKGEIHYFFEIISPKELAQHYPEVFQLDSLSLIKEKNIKMVVNKSVYIVNKPVGFFDDQQLSDEKYVAHVLGEQVVKKTGPASYKVTVPGEGGFSYKMHSYFDADDISTLPSSKVTRAVTSARELDVISKSASTVMLTEKTNFTKYTEGGVSISSYIPMKENKTLIITYNLWAVKKPFAIRGILKSSYLQEVEAVKSLQESFK